MINWSCNINIFYYNCMKDQSIDLLTTDHYDRYMNNGDMQDRKLFKKRGTFRFSEDLSNRLLPSELPINGNFDDFRDDNLRPFRLESQKPLISRHGIHLFRRQKETKWIQLKQSQSIPIEKLQEKQISKKRQISKQEGGVFRVPENTFRDNLLLTQSFKNYKGPRTVLKSASIKKGEESGTSDFGFMKNFKSIEVSPHQKFSKKKINNFTIGELGAEGLSLTLQSPQKVTLFQKSIKETSKRNFTPSLADKKPTKYSKRTLTKIMNPDELFKAWESQEDRAQNQIQLYTAKITISPRARNTIDFN